MWLSFVRRLFFWKPDRVSEYSFAPSSAVRSELVARYRVDRSRFRVVRVGSLYYVLLVPTMGGLLSFVERGMGEEAILGEAVVWGDRSLLADGRVFQSLFKAYSDLIKPIEGKLRKVIMGADPGRRGIVWMDANLCQFYGGRVFEGMDWDDKLVYWYLMKCESKLRRNG